MPRFLKTTLRIGFWLGLVLAVVLSAAVFDFLRWRGEIIERRANDPDRQVAATSLGVIEYAIVGEGRPRLVLHGGPGGYDQSLIGQRTRPDDSGGSGMVIAVSRPGSLGTPLSSGETPAAQADLYAALLDELNVDQVVVVATSAGTASAMQFALRHREQTRALVLISPAIQPYNETSPDLGKWGAMASDFGIWASYRFVPGLWAPNYDRRDPGKVEFARINVEAMIPLEARWPGNRNDVAQSQAAPIPDWPLEDITTPTIVFHGDEDNLTSYTASQDAAARIPGAQFVSFEGGDHFINLSHGSEIRMRIAAFLDALPQETSEDQGSR